MTTPLLTRGYVSRIEKVYEHVMVTLGASPTALVKSLEISMPGVAVEALGIHPSDVIIRTAIVAALADIRANPWLLDYVFAALPRDEQTYKDYGEKSVARAKEWFLKTDIPVSMVPRIDEGRWPRITISLADSQEVENTLGDVHSTPIEYIQNGTWAALTSPFTPMYYTPATGKIKLPAVGGLVVGPGMYIIDHNGNEHEILVVESDSVVYIAENTMADFRGCVIKGVKPTIAVHLESAAFKETYNIGVHVGQEPVYLTWLHSIVSFALLRYRKSLLEGRGFERTSFNSSDFRREETFESELVFSRYITITGYVRNYWPSHVVPTINTTYQPIKVNPADQLPTGPNDVNAADALWVGENDVLNTDGIG